jgi:ribosomal protein S12 methylthiotransferase
VNTKNKIWDSILFVTLGCAKNIVDSEKLMYQLSANGVQIETDEENSRARIVIINTCGFIEDAKKESLDVTFNYLEKKQKGIIDKVYLIGCLVERYKKILPGEMPEIDEFFGVNQVKEIVEISGHRYKNSKLEERLISTPSHYAYLKIAEGCDRKCSFCAIPKIRGQYVSFPVQNLVNEANFLAQKGVKELILVAQDISSYGKDLNKTYLLSKLIERLSEIRGLEWIRLHYAYPKDFPEDMLNTIRDNPKVCKYIDMPVQHISDNMLKRMRRGLNKNKTKKLIEKIRNSVPGIAIRTTLLVGHPGETTKDFEELVEFIEEARFERLGVFKYSHEEDTFAWKKYKDQVSLIEKNRRIETIMSIQKNISHQKNKSFIGKDLKVIIDNKCESFYSGRTQFDSPEIDNEVIVQSQKILETGRFYNVKIAKAEEYDLSGIVS